MSVITYAGEPAIPPNQVRDHCSRQGLPNDWYGQPNGYLNMLGVESGRGVVLLSRASLDKITLDGERDLVLSADSARLGGRALPPATVTLKNLHITRARCLTPGMRSDPAATYLVDLADRRALAAFRVVNAGFNVRVPSGSGAYDPATLVSTGPDTPWTWSGMVGSLWAACDLLGSYPGLPYAPDGAPLNVCFYDSPAMTALGATLADLGLALRPDLEAATFSIVDLADDDLANEAILTANDSTIRIYDDDEILPTYGRIPAKARVRFRQMIGAAFWGGDTFYTVDVTDPNGVAAGADPDSVVILDDDYTAYYNTAGSLQNGAALTARAAERAEAYFDQLRASQFRRVFGMPIPGLSPGPRVRSVFFGDRGRGAVTQDGGLLTEVMRSPVPQWRGPRSNAPPATLIAYTGNGVTTTDSGPVWLLGFHTDHGLYFQAHTDGTARVGQQDANATWGGAAYAYQDGKVGHADQTWGGYKTFLDPVTIGDEEESRAEVGYLKIVRDATRSARLEVYDTLLSDMGSYFISDISDPVTGWLSGSEMEAADRYTALFVFAYDPLDTPNIWKDAGYGIVNTVGARIHGKWGADSIGNQFEGGIITTIATGPVGVAEGGTGLTATPTNGQLLIGNGSGYTLATLTQGSGISITNGAGSITIATTGVATASFVTISVSGQSDIVADAAADTLTIAAGAGITLTTNASTDTLTIAASGTALAFKTIAVSGQSDVVADAADDTLTLVGGTGITLTTNASTDTVTITASGSASNSFTTISVAGQSDVVADSSTDTLTLVAGAGATITTNAGTDTITIAAAASTSVGTLAATGSTQGTAATLTATNTQVSGADNTKGVILSAAAGHVLAIYNPALTDQLKVYPPTGEKISVLATNAADLLASGGRRVYWDFGTGVWWYDDLT